MRDDAWELPGLRTFVSDLRARLERGDQLAIATPTGFDGLALEDHVRRTTPSFLFQGLQVSQLNGFHSDPFDALGQALGVRTPKGRLLTSDDIAQDPALAGTCVWIHGAGDLAAEECDRWGRFVSDYARAARRAGDSFSPPQLVLPLHGVPATGLVEEEPGRSTAWWWGRLSRLDIEVFVAERNPLLDPVERAQVVEIAGFDLGLAEQLAELSTIDVDRLVGILASERVVEPEHASPRSCECRPDSPADLLDAWSLRLIDRFDNQPRAYWHSGLYLEEPGLATLRRRLWRGQVRALLPQVEEWRVQLIEAAKTSGFVAGGVPIHDLDFGDLHNHLRARRDPPHRERMAEFAGWLRGTRNRLAHLDPIDADRRQRGERLAAVALRSQRAR